MKKGDTWDCGRSVWFDTYVDLMIYDEDPGGDDHLLNTTIHLNDLTLGQEVTITSEDDHGDADYKLIVVLVAQDVAPLV